jgi:hypothetical protein
MHSNKLVLSVRHIRYFILCFSLAVSPTILLHVLVILTPSSIFIFARGVKFSICDEEATARRMEQSATVRYCVHIKRNKAFFPLPLFKEHHRVLSWSLSYFMHNRVAQIPLTKSSLAYGLILSNFNNFGIHFIFL